MTSATRLVDEAGPTMPATRLRVSSRPRTLPTSGKYVLEIGGDSGEGRRDAGSRPRWNNMPKIAVCASASPDLPAGNRFAKEVTEMKRLLVAVAPILVLTLGTAALAQTSGTGTTEKPGTSAGTSGSTTGSMSGKNNTTDMGCERGRTPSNQMSSSGPSGEKHGAAKPAENECGPAGTSGSSTSPGARGGGASGAGH